MNISKEMEITDSNDGAEISYWTCGEGLPLELVHRSLGDHTQWGTLRTLPPIVDGGKSYTAYLAGFSPEAAVSRRHHSRNQWIASLSSPAWRHWPSDLDHEMQNGGF